MNGIRIDHSTIETDFQGHIGLKENNRILFTAPFGAGKSTFLQEVFEKNKTDYFTINLFPVNYSVSANEDVFELIKFDLLIELLGKYKKEINLQKEDFSALLLSQMFVLKELKLTPVIFAILKQCGKIGKSAVDIIEEVKKQYEDFKEDMKYDENELIANFLTLIENQKGSENEMDSISALIKNLVCRVKAEKKDKEKEKEKNIQSVLIIDDLDRLDPEHTFRLINIFSAHFDKIDNSNKFGFDKVIFVCDYENIRKIFYHKYGPDVDFAGYSDKFFSLTPYQFDNRQYVKEKIEEIMKKIKLGSYAHLFQQVYSYQLTVTAIINSLIDARLLNLRMLLNYPAFEVPDTLYYGTFTKIQKVQDSKILTIFYFLKNFYGSFKTLRSKLEYLYNQLGNEEYTSHINLLADIKVHAYQKLISLCLPFILPNKILDEWGDTETNTRYFYEKYNCHLHFRQLGNTSRPEKEFIKATNGKDSNTEEYFLNPYQVLLDVFDNCQKLGAFK